MANFILLKCVVIIPAKIPSRKRGISVESCLPVYAVSVKTADTLGESQAPGIAVIESIPPFIYTEINLL